MSGIKIIVSSRIFYDLNKFNKPKAQKERQKRKKNVDNKDFKLYHDFLGIYFDEYYELSDT